MKLDFIPCKKSDINTLVSLSKTTFIKAFEKDNDPHDFSAYISTAFNKETLLLQLKNPDSAFYFVYVKEQLIGYMKLNQHQAQTDIKKKDSMELERIYILEAFQGRGYGAMMLDKAVAIAIEANKNFVWLGVWEKNLKAIRFYERYGFVTFGTHPYYVGSDKQTDWLMKYDLSTKMESTRKTI
ncbi:GNAT family N-acetyltransferase [Maribacter chungangensis]|uniref:GNAT family N-acetyltransferase n=1 Tax=Maribacter chungangensis TaxID=1069117 RepID=A0ABW3AZG0_9FLAO